MNINLRLASLDILAQWEKDRIPVNLLLDRAFQKINLPDPRDRNLVTALTLGVIRWQRYLDWILAKHSSQPLKKINPKALLALRIGLFQLLFMDRIPPSAAINETVEALKASGQPKWIVGFVNGILRNIARLPQITKPEDAGASIPAGVRYSHPDWLLTRWRQRYGTDDAEKICRTNNEMAPLCLRINTRVTSTMAYLDLLKEHGIAAQSGLFAPDAIRVEGAHAVEKLPGFAQGSFQVQDESAQLAVYLLGPLQPGKIYLDACAGLGGKTSHLAQMLPLGSDLIAAEPDPGRKILLEENLRRLQLAEQVTVVQGDIKSLHRSHARHIHAALVDAPCSGLGVIRRHPDIRWNRTEKDLVRFQKMQLELLDDMVGLLAPGGLLVYATCSMEPEENHMVIEKFLARCPGFIIDDARLFLPDSAGVLVDGHGFFSPIANLHGIDGFFAARLRKTN